MIDSYIQIDLKKQDTYLLQYFDLDLRQSSNNINTKVL
jgi:hypothetical protein